MLSYCSLMSVISILDVELSFYDVTYLYLLVIALLIMMDYLSVLLLVIYLIVFYLSLFRIPVVTDP